MGTGVSTDVGGGYGELALSDIPLLWMVKRARDVGLAFKADCLTPFAHFPPSVAFTPSRGARPSSRPMASSCGGGSGALGGIRTSSLLIRSKIPAVQPVRSLGDGRVH